MDHELAQHALAHKAGKKPKALKEFHAKELHDGTYHVTKHHGDSREPSTGSAKHLHEVHAHMDAHMGKPNAGEEAAEGGTGSAAEEEAEGEVEHRFFGGPVSPMKPYVVGEGGPEIFRSAVPGHITPSPRRQAI